MAEIAVTIIIPAGEIQVARMTATDVVVTDVTATAAKICVADVAATVATICVAVI